MAKDISPEERLFNVINEGKKDSGAQAGVAAGKPRGLKQMFSGWLKPQHNIQHPALALSSFPVKLENIDINLVNRSLVIILAIILAAAIFSGINKGPNLSKLTSISSRYMNQITKPKPAESFKPLAYYTEQVRKRDLFSPNTSEASASGGRRSQQEIAKDLSLAGIYQGEYPEAMIEDKVEKKTYFLKEGDEIKGMKVKSILKDRVILQYESQDIELL